MIQIVALVFYEYRYDTKILMIKAPLISETIIIYYTICIIYGILYIVAREYKRKKHQCAKRRQKSNFNPLSIEIH